MLTVKKIFGPTIQGEGTQSGMGAVFVRFGGCNMWNGDPETRARSACPYCDTDFQGGEPKTPEDIVEMCKGVRGLASSLLVVLTGGEPMLQPEEDLVNLTILLRREGFKTQVETNGTVWLPEFASLVDFITVSPKVPFSRLKVDWKQVDCLKLLCPHPTVKISDFLHLPTHVETRHIDFCLQPIEPNETQGKSFLDLIESQEWWTNIGNASDKVKRYGYPWRLSLQTHKLLGEE